MTFHTSNDLARRQRTKDFGKVLEKDFAEGGLKKLKKIETKAEISLNRVFSSVLLIHL
jgi:hypothetical protein